MHTDVPIHDTSPPEQAGCRVLHALGTEHCQRTADGQCRAFTLQVVQPGLLGLIDGSISTLAPLFATAFATGEPHVTFLVGLAASIGAALSMGISEGLSDDGALTGRGSAALRGTVTGVATFLGGILHTLPFLIPHQATALALAFGVVGFELVAISWLRWRFLETRFWPSVAQVVLGGVLVIASGILIGSA